MTDPYLYAVGYDVGFEDGFKEAQDRVKEMEVENRRLRELLSGFYASEDIEYALRLKGDSDE